VTSPSGPLPDELRNPAPARLPAEAPGYRAICSAHEAAMARGDAVYRDPFTGLYAMTAAYLWDRGECCQSGCRHCPWLDRGSPTAER
jgi:hypothetical protein